MRRFLTVFVLIVFNFLMQTTFFKALAMASVVPNLLIILTFAFSFMRGQKEGMVVGFFCGILIDMFYGDILGFYALIYMFVGYLNGYFTKIFFYEDITLPIALCAGSDLLYGLCVFVFRFVLRNRLDFPSYFFKVMIPELIYTIIIMIIIYRPLLWINKRLEACEKRGAGKVV